MEIDITGRHFKVTEPLARYIKEKISKLDKYSLKLESVHVVLEVQKFRHISEITLLCKNMRLTAKEHNLEMYAAFDESFYNIQLQMARRHDRVKDHKGRRYGVKDGGARKKTRRALKAA